MSIDLLASLGITDEQFAAAKDSTVREAFENMPSGVYPGKIKEVILYKNKFGGETLRINVTVKYNETERTLTFRDDIGQKLAPTKEQKEKNEAGSSNGGYNDRIKSLCSAANIDLSDLKPGEATTVKAFGADCEGRFFLGANEKPVQVLVMLSVDDNKSETDKYREKNDIEGVLPKDHADIEKFKAKVEKYNGKFHYRGYVKKDAANTSGSAGSAEVQDAAAKLNF